MTMTAGVDALTEAYRSIPMSPFVRAKPTGKQMAFLANMGKEALYGGTARSMKSWAALMAAMQFSCVPGYGAIIFRRERVSLELPEGLIDIANSWLGDSEAKWSGDKYRWTFPSGATLSFGYLSERRDLMKYHSSAYQFILFEEIAEWPTNDEYSYMFSRLTPKKDFDGEMPRCKCHGWSVADVPLRMRGTANPGGPGQAWVRANFIIPHRKGVRGIFHPASYKDNPFLDHGEYERTVAKMKPIDRARILGGDWDISAPGDRFSRDWFQPMPERWVREFLADPSCRLIRRWDMAGTKPNKLNKDPDWTVGALVAHREVDTADQWLIVDIERFQDTSGSVIKRMKVVAKLDEKKYKRAVPIRVEREPGTQARMAMAIVKRDHFKGWNFRAVPSKIRKEDRIDVLAIAAEAGECFYEEGVDWAEAYLDECEAYGNPGVKDDQPDATSGAIMDLSRGGGGRVGARRGERLGEEALSSAGTGEPSGYGGYATGSTNVRTRAPSGMSGGYDSDF